MAKLTLPRSYAAAAAVEGKQHLVSELEAILNEMDAMRGKTSKEDIEKMLDLTKKMIELREKLLK